MMIKNEYDHSKTISLHFLSIRTNEILSVVTNKSLPNGNFFLIFHLPYPYG